MLGLIRASFRNLFVLPKSRWPVFMFLMICIIGFIGSKVVFADNINLEMGKAQIVKLSRTPDAIIIGDPKIADAVIKNDGLLLLFGLEPGETNLIALDENGKTLISSSLVVGPMLKRRVTINSGLDTFTLSCNPRCIPIATPGAANAQTSNGVQGGVGEESGAAGGSALSATDVPKPGGALASDETESASK